MTSFKSSNSNFSEMKLLKEIIRGENSLPEKRASKDISDTLGAALAKQLVRLPKTGRSTQTNWKWRVMAERWRGAKLITPNEKHQEAPGVKKSQVVFKLEKPGTEPMSDGGDEPRITDASPSQLRMAKSRDDLWMKKKAIRDKRIELTGLRLAREYDKIVDTSDLIFDPVDPNIQQVLIGKAASQRGRRKTLSHLGTEKAHLSTGADMETCDHGFSQRTSAAEGMESPPVSSPRSSIARKKYHKKESMAIQSIEGTEGSIKSDPSGDKSKSLTDSKKQIETGESKASSSSSGKSDKKGQPGARQKGDKKGGADKFDEPRLSDPSEMSERRSSKRSDTKSIADISEKSDKRRQRDEKPDNKPASDVSDRSDKGRLSEFSDKKSFSEKSDGRARKDS